MSEVSLELLFSGLQEELESKLGGVRRSVAHAGAKGAASEGGWRELLNGLLPARYTVSKGFVVDSSGKRSDEIDLIVHDRVFSPVLFPYKDALHIPAESVYAVLECKQEISKENLIYAGRKAASVRGLLRTSATIRHAGGTYPPRTPPRILAGILALDSAWATGLGEHLELQLRTLTGLEAVDLGCVVRHGSFAFDGKSFVRSRAAHSLAWFLVRLISDLQMMGTVPAIDFSAYLAQATEPATMPAAEGELS